MRRIVPALVAAFIVGLAVFATTIVTAMSDQRRSIVLLLAALVLAVPTSIGVRGRFGAGAAASIWLAFAPLFFAIARVMKRHVEALELMSHNGFWHDPAPLARGALEWRLDTPFVQGNFREPEIVAGAWAIVAFAVAGGVALLIRSRAAALFAKALPPLAWSVTVLAVFATGFAFARERGKTTALEWAERLPLLPLPEQLQHLDCDAVPPEGETLHGPMYDVEVTKSTPCSVRLVRGEARSANMGPPDGLTLHHDPILDVDVLVSRRAASLVGKVDRLPPIRVIPRDLRMWGAASSLVALALLLYRRRREPAPEGPTSAYRGAVNDDPLRDDARLVRAAAALTIAALGVAPLVPLVRFVF